MQTPRSMRHSRGRTRAGCAPTTTTDTPSKPSPRSRQQQRTNPRGLFDCGIWHCDCSPRLPAEHFKVRKAGASQGRWFYTCQKDKTQSCGFFLWDEEAKTREAVAVMGNRRSEPRAAAEKDKLAQEGVKVKEMGSSVSAGNRNVPSHPAAASKTNKHSSENSATRSLLHNTSAKRSAREALLDEDEDDEFAWSPTGPEIAELADVAAAADPNKHALTTPRKAVKTGVYATPATTTTTVRDKPRVLPWLAHEDPVTSFSTKKSVADYFQPPSAAVALHDSITTTSPSPPSKPPLTVSPKTPPQPTTTSTKTTTSTTHDTRPPLPSSPHPQTRHKDALHNPNDAHSSLTADLLATLQSHLPNPSPDLLLALRALTTKHDLRAQGWRKGRDIARLALQARDQRITTLESELAKPKAEGRVAEGGAAS